MKTTYFLADYSTHAVLWQVTITGEYRTDETDPRMFRDRDGRTCFAFFDIKANRADILDNYRDYRQFAMDLGDETETVILNEGQMGQHVQM